MKSFYANHISCSQDDDVFTIGLADDELDPIDFVILSRIDEPDMAVNQQIGLLVNETEFEFQDVIESIRFFDTQIVIQLAADKVAEELEYTSIHIELTDQNEDLPRAIKRMFAGSSVQLKFN
ncbi:hypothetical protein [Acinetobacter sp. ANC 4641]|uniref:hypothetical protein n=1 Tax=Acinetobacter sp. ANC 4641 TaxID=2529847 RepID=UPI00103F5BB4|nr:hypothetical protein [Acinetobacter sp. ANC 4641]TCB11493.1 hypothetical protein E0H78_07625 [Acinetobacter sp. ANC 4641]